MSETSTAASTLTPCPYPGCRDINGQPHLTRQTICDPSRRHYRRVLDRLVLGYLEIRATLPKPPAGTSNSTVIRTSKKEYGHPAEWASDFARLIADHLNEAHDGLADHLNHTPAPHPGNREVGKVSCAYRYLTNWFSELCTYPAAADTAIALVDLDRKVRSGLGRSTPRRGLHIPCPECELLTLTRRLDVEESGVDCTGCGNHIPEQEYGAWVRVLMDDILDSSEQS